MQWLQPVLERQQRQYFFVQERGLASGEQDNLFLQYQPVPFKVAGGSPFINRLVR